MELSPLGPRSGARIQPRVKRAPRGKLNYLKCDFCRRAKVACIPADVPNDDQRCKRCLERKFECTARTRKPSNHFHENCANNQSLLQIARPPSLRESRDQKQREEYEILSLFSLHYILGIAFAEFLELSDELLATSMGEFDEYRGGAFFWSSLRLAYNAFDAIIRAKIDGSSSGVIASVSTAALDLAMIHRDYKGNEETTARYRDAGHVLMCFALRMRQLMTKRRMTPKDVTNFLHVRGNVRPHIANVCAELKDTTLPSMFKVMHNQPFTPRRLCRQFKIMQTIREDGRSDWLGRSVGQIAHDSGARGFSWPNDILDNHDLLGRSVLHLAVLRKDYVLFPTNASNLVRILVKEENLQRPMCFFPVLHVAASRGDLTPFKILEATPYYFKEALKRRDLLGRHCLHWAASCGQLTLVQYLCKAAADDADQELRQLDNENCSPLHLAARSGHTKVVEYILRQVPSIASEFDERTPILSATGVRIKLEPLGENYD